jgi:hypothetical protein
MSNAIETELRSQRDDEAWMHAACLTIAETGQKWGENVRPSPAMEAVYRLRQEHDRLFSILFNQCPHTFMMDMMFADKIDDLPTYCAQQSKEGWEFVQCIPGQLKDQTPMLFLLFRKPV